MHNAIKNRYRNQIADLILKDPSGEDLVVTSAMLIGNDGAVFFEVGQDRRNGDRYRVTVKIEEV